MSKPADREGPDSAVWFKYFPARWAALAMREQDDARLGTRLRGIILALCEQEQGADPFADAVMQSTAEAMRAASEHARKAAIASWEKRRGKGVCPSNARASDGEGNGCPSNAKRRDSGDSEDVEDETRGDSLTEKTRGDLPTDLPTDLPSGHEQPREESGRARKKKPSIKKSTKSEGGDNNENLATLPNESLPSYAVRFCHEENPESALRVYQEIMARIRPDSFREELQAFTDEIEAGKEPDSRAEALVARLMKKISEPKKQKTGK